ncbi:GyrI-like domain-containing protein [Sediminibacillus albus]|uniref:Predicted transcriptional regulator YdeE, contains AraC-type DNA-binding domain n=1 Tax=Sediminibacillus albus TaxID=407036 RepID=A0A1G8WJC7_9BACI|nr:GyrI-like domain-containing protein [Sediminibacillus albus]SDJ78414.1 Predicted transcriptional regulator YdeE, contains AraC-type DNA-binding domain [Sediminibacillus albus]
MRSFDYQIVQAPAYRAIGLKWEGPYTEITELKQMINRMSLRVSELRYAVEPDIQLGLSYHTRLDGFVHFSLYQVSEEQKLPDGMIEVYVPSMTYLKTQHRKGQDISRTYQELEASEYQTYTEDGGEYFDNLPIKHERYPAERDAQDPHFEILIPVIKK